MRTKEPRELSILAALILEKTQLRMSDFAKEVKLSAESLRASSVSRRLSQEVAVVISHRMGITLDDLQGRGFTFVKGRSKKSVSPALCEMAAESGFKPDSSETAALENAYCAIRPHLKNLNQQTLEILFRSALFECR